MNLTANELELLEAIDNSEYGCYLTDEVYYFTIEDNSALNAKSIPGILGSLVKKGLVNTSVLDFNFNGKDVSEETVWITEPGANAYVAAKGAENVEKLL